MKQSSNKSRPNGRHSFYNNNNRRNSIPSKNTVYDSSGPCGRLRGTSAQLVEKYQSAAKDVRHNDSIISEICLQYADHYQRLFALASLNDRPAQQPTPETPVESQEPAPVEETPVVTTEEVPTPAPVETPPKPARRPRKARTQEMPVTQETSIATAE